jgi:hypothetical protein
MTGDGLRLIIGSDLAAWNRTAWPASSVNDPLAAAAGECR